MLSINILRKKSNIKNRPILVRRGLSGRLRWQPKASEGIVPVKRNCYFEQKGNKNCRANCLEVVGFLTAGAYSPFLRYVVEAMSIELNQEYVNDTAKLMIHRLIARAISRDPSLVQKAKVSLDRSSQHFEGYSFLREWSELLDLPPSEVRRLLASRSERMMRLRLSSPFILAEGIDFGNTALRRRIWRAAKRVAQASPTFAEFPRMVA
jgi:hypothetical protein